MLSDYPVYATIATADLERARTFYEQTLGFSIVTEDQAGGVYYQSGTTHFYLYPSQFAGHAQHTLASWEVDDIGSVIDELAGRGVVFENRKPPVSVRIPTYNARATSVVISTNPPSGIRLATSAFVVQSSSITASARAICVCRVRR